MKVPLIINHLLADRRIARAAHPVINAWRCKVDITVHQGQIPADHHFSTDPKVLTCSCIDNDDDGETAAGGRLAHLLQILVSARARWFFWIHTNVHPQGCRQCTCCCNKIFWWNTSRP